MNNNYGFISTRFYRIMEWIWRLAYLNILWIFFTLIGLGVFGVFPATASIYAVNRKWLLGDSEIPIFKVFWTSFKENFFKANMLGITLVVIGYVLYFNVNYLSVSSGMEHTLLSGFFYITVVCYFFLLCYLFPIFVHFELTFFRYFMVAIIIPFTTPFTLISTLVSLAIALYMLYLFPGLIPFFAVSVLSWLIMWNSTHAFRRIENKKRRINNNEESFLSKIRVMTKKFFSTHQTR
ncbi:YesL family protein [Gracilibacillus alcaliphilus]|uniref:YesL family protein n=1 Tax=Gracilibacillus alcaliphilus TaxID=1401441 RepID=UPI001958C532|nr:YesL family protein [Gracilibacillus alcaliphilus]MBM7677058.1 putative membrane protein YesL [Gracilibacillus alcaliphilus]